jgi:hypothetical protein
MKINHLLLLLLLGLCAPWTAKGQDTIVPDPLTLNNGNTASSSIPFRGECVAFGTHSQFIIPQGDLTAMRGGTVNKLTLYSRSQSVSWGSAKYSVYMAEVTYDAFTSSALADWDSMNEVYTGTLSVNNNLMEITLENPFTYYGDNLMIGFREVEMGTNSSNVLWDGAATTNKSAVISYRTNSQSQLTCKRFSFLPKLTIDYFILDYPTVEVTVGDITPTTASFSWMTPSDDVTGYKYQYNKASEGFAANWVDLPPTATSVTLEGLDPVTDYVFRIKACYGANESAMTIVDFRSACPDYIAVPYFENFESYEVYDELLPRRRVLPDCWEYVNTSTNPYDKVFPSIHSLSGNSYTYAYYSTKSLRFYIDNNSSLYEAKPQYAILPAMQNINGLRVTLYARSYSSTSMFSGKFKVGVMEDTETGPVFVPVNEFNPTVNYQPFTIDFGSYDGTGERIAIWMEVPNTYFGCVFIDNIEVERLPTFSMPIASHGGTLGGWYLISCPLAGETNPEDVTHLIDTINLPDFDLFRFNPNPANQGKNWENWKQVGDHYHFNLESGRGYLYANADNVNLSFNGTPYDGNGEVTLQYDEVARYGGWNLVGNPFPVAAYIGDRAYYRVNEDGTDYEPAITGSAIEAMEGIFVYTENDGEVLTFSTTPPTTRSEQLSLSVNRVTRGGLITTFDRAILRFGEGDMLPKFQLNEENAKVYIPQNGLEYAVVTAEGQGEMPVNFRADESGSYTLSLDCENVEFSYLHLFDNKTGTDVDLLNTPTYTFNATTTDYESRFKLVFATGSSIDDDDFSFINSNGNFSIFGIEGEANLQVLDVMGRVLSTETFSNSIEKRLNVAPGVYFIRLVNGEDVKTQKIVVR